MENKSGQRPFFHRALDAVRRPFANASHAVVQTYGNVTGATTAKKVEDFHDEMEQVYAAIVARVIELEDSHSRLRRLAWTGTGLSILSILLWIAHWAGYLN